MNYSPCSGYRTYDLGIFIMLKIDLNLLIEICLYNYIPSNPYHVSCDLSRYSLNHPVSVRVCDFNRAGHIPGNVNHGHNGLDLSQIIPFKPFQSQLVLVSLKNNKMYTVTRVQKTDCRRFTELLCLYMCFI